MTFRASVERYLGAVAQQYHRGDAREESYYDELKPRQQSALSVQPQQQTNGDRWMLTLGSRMSLKLG